MLKYAGEINRLWTYNGVVNIKFEENDDEYPTKIYHPDDINYYFDEDTLSSIFHSTKLGTIDDISSVWKY